MASQRCHIFSPIPLLEMRPPEQWHCTFTLPFRATSDPIKRSSPTPESSMRRRQATQLSPYNIGPQQGPSSQRSRKIARRSDTISFTLLRSPQKRRGHAYTPNKPFPTQSPSDSTRQLLQCLRHWPHRCQHRQHQRRPQHIGPRQIKQWTPQQN